MSDMNTLNPNPALNTLQQVDNAIRTGKVLLQLEGVEQARKQGEIERLRAELVHSTRARSNVVAQQEVVALQGQLSECQNALVEKERLIIEWMHSNEAFKRLATKYGRRLDIGEEQQASDRADAVLDVAEEDPKFAHTKLAAKAKAKLGVS